MIGTGSVANTKKLMKILLRQVEDGSYYVSPGRWTKELIEAHDFKRGVAAIESAFDQGLKDVEVLYGFSDSVPNIERPAMDFSIKLLSPRRGEQG